MQQDLTECTLKFSADDRYYKKYNIKNSKTNEEIETGIDPIKNKLFDQDVFKINEKGEAAIYHSSLRSMQNIPAILVLEGDRIYGKTNKGRPL